MNDEQFMEYLRNWYRKNKDNKEKWNDNPIGVGIRKMVKLLGRWKGLPRGNPKEGHKAMLISPNLKKETESHKIDDVDQW